MGNLGVVRRRGVALGLWALVGAWAGCGDSGPGPVARPAAAVVGAENARGIALLDAGRPQDAIAPFQRVVEALPDVPDAHANLGIAYLHAVGLEGATDRAAASFERAVALRADHPHANYGLALLAMRDQRDDEALARLRKVEVVDPDDPDVQFCLGRIFVQKGQLIDKTKQPEAARRFREAAAAQFHRTIELRPDYSSAYNGLAGLRRADMGTDPSAAEDVLRLVSKNIELQEAGKINRFFGQGYSERGRYAMAVRMFGRGASAQIVAVALPTLRDMTAESGLDARDGRAGAGASRLAEAGPCLVFFDRDNDADDDLLVAGLVVDGQATCRLYINEAGRFVDATDQLPADAIAGALAATAGDFDRDGRCDLFLVSATGPRLLLNRPGRFASVPGLPEARTTAPGMPCFVDFDHDGDLDVYVPATDAAGGQLLRNLGTGQLVDVSGETALSKPAGPALGSLWLDVDNDGDSDAIVPALDGTVQVFENRRENGHASHVVALPSPGVLAVTAGDLDNDGWIDLVATRDSVPMLLRLRNVRGTFEAAALALPDTFGDWQAMWGAALADLDHDGDLDLIVTGERGSGGVVAVIANDGTGGFADQASVSLALPAPGRAVALADVDGDGDLDLAVATFGGPVTLVRNDGGNRLAVLPLRLADADYVTATGQQQQARGPTASASAAPTSTSGGVPAWSRTVVPGAKVQMHAGRFYQKRDVRTASGLFGQSTRTLHFGLGDQKTVHAVEIEWSSGTLQSELDLPVGKMAEVRQYDVRRASCPFLFVWDGQKHRFLGDLLAGSPPGLFLRPGLYASCDTDEYIRIAGDVLAPRDGQYELVVHECLDEITYLDFAQLWAVDTPAGTTLFPNERFAGPPPFAAFGLHVVSERIHPRRAVNHRGNDVLAALLAPDDEKIVRDLARLDTPGFTERHHIELDFGAVARPAAAQRLVLFLHGYLRFPGSPSQFDAYQRGRRFQLPALEIAAESGAWRVAAENIGAPAGFSRTITYDITQLVADHAPASGPLRMRIACNIEVYWDEAFIAITPADPDPLVRIQRVPPASAELSSVGFPAMTPRSAGLPETYDYARLLTVPVKSATGRQVRWNKMLGRYTRFGDVGPLLLEADDMYVIFGPGEQVRLRFDADAFAPPLPGTVRTFLFALDGWVKDRFYHTATGATVFPLPFHDMKAYPDPAADTFPWTDARRKWQAEHNTRVIWRSDSF